MFMIPEYLKARLTSVLPSWPRKICRIYTAVDQMQHADRQEQSANTAYSIESGVRSGQLKGNLRSRSEARRNHLHPVFGGGGDLIIHCKPPGWGISACVAQLGLFKDHHGDGEFESPSLSFSFPHTPNLHTYTHITYHIVHLPSGSRFFCCSPHLLVKMID